MNNPRERARCRFVLRPHGTRPAPIVGGVRSCLERGTRPRAGELPGGLEDYDQGHQGNGRARMLSHTTSTIRNRPSSAGASASKPLAFLVVVATLLCHGFFGALHLFPDGQVPATEVAAQGSPFAGAGDAHEESAVQSADKEYFAVLVMLVLFLGLLLRRSGPWHGHAAPRSYFSPRTRLRVPHPARGPTAPLLQVFRL